jgi:hypothetical protein
VNVNFGNLIKIVDTVMSLWEPGKPQEEPRAGQRERARPLDAALPQSSPSGLADQIELRLTNVVIAALKEAFDRDHQRLELERTHLEEQRRRAEEAARMELRRETISHEVGRLRLLSGIALVGWIVAVIVLAVRQDDMSILSKTMLASGWLLFIGSLAASITTQSKLNAYLLKANMEVDVDTAGNGALWFLMAGLALSATSLLL